MKKYDVICVGSAAVDCFVDLPVDFKGILPGSKVLLEDMKMFTGGGGTNVAVGCSRLGLDSGFVGEVGDDLSAEMIRSELKKENVDFLVKHHSRHRTAFSVVLESKGKDRAILVYKGASSYLHRDEIPKLSASWYYFASVVGASFETLKHIGDRVREEDSKIYFNPSGYMIKSGREKVVEIAKRCHVLQLNKEEAFILAMREGTIKDILRHLAGLGPKIVVITDGKKGVYAYDGRLFYHEDAHELKPLDTTGAGDAFGAGMLVGLFRFRDIRKALKLGIMNAESVIMKLGAKEGLIRKKDLAMKLPKR